MHKYDLHVGDYTRDTVGLSMIEDGAYRRLLDQCYATELPLPPDKREVYRIARATSPAERKAVDYVLGKYFTQGPDGYRNGRADREIAAYQNKSEGASKAAEVRWENHRKRTAHANGHANAYADADANASETHMQSQSDGNANPRASLPSSTLHPPPTGGKAKAREPAPPFAPPDWVPRSEWDDFDEMRRRKSGKGWTLRARELAVDELAKLVGQGEDAAAVLRQSVLRTWAGLFPVGRGKGGVAHQREPTLAERKAANMEVLTGRAGNERVIDGGAASVDRAALPTAAGDLRKPSEHDVGGG